MTSYAKSPGVARAAKWLLSIAFALTPLWAHASDGLLLLGNGPIQVSRAGAGVASPRAASWMMLNPGSIVALEKRWDHELAVLWSDIGFKSRGLSRNPFAADMRHRACLAAPGGGIVWPLRHGTLGLGLFVPSGASVDFPTSRNILSLLQGNTDRRLRYAQTRLVLAYAHQFDNGWALGFSVNGSVSMLRTDHETLRLHPTRGANEWDEALGAGLGIGIYRKWDKWAFGASYASRQWSETFDKYDDLLRHPVDLPPVVQVGLARELTPKLELVMDYKFIDRSNVRILRRDAAEGGLAWNSQHALKAGLEWRPTDRWTLRAGYSFTTSALKKRQAFISGLVPLVMRHHVAVGASYAPNKTSEFHLSYVHALRKGVSDSGESDLFSILGKGTEVSLKIDGVWAGYTYKF